MFWFNLYFPLFLCITMLKKRKIKIEQVIKDWNTTLVCVKKASPSPPFTYRFIGPQYSTWSLTEEELTLFLSEFLFVYVDTVLGKKKVTHSNRLYKRGGSLAPALSSDLFSIIMRLTILLLSPLWMEYYSITALPPDIMLCLPSGSLAPIYTPGSRELKRNETTRCMRRPGGGFTQPS